MIIIIIVIIMGNEMKRRIWLNDVFAYIQYVSCVVFVDIPTLNCTYNNGGLAGTIICHIRPMPLYFTYGEMGVMLSPEGRLLIISGVYVR